MNDHEIIDEIEDMIDCDYSFEEMQISITGNHNVSLDDFHRCYIEVQKK